MRRVHIVPFVTSWQRIDDCDLNPQAEPETTVFLPNRERIDGLHILGLDTDLMLGIRVSEFGIPLTCAITLDIALDIPLQSNPVRHIDEGDQA